MKTYSAASQDLATCIANMQAQHHEDLVDVAIGALFVFDSESNEPVLSHHGYPASAMVRIAPLRERALGVADAVIIVDRATWQTLSAPQKDALIDHELQHLARVENSKDGGKAFDALDRPKLAMRRHDHQLGWFDAIAQRHGQASPEMRQAKQLLAVSQQLYFDFGTRSTDAAVAGGATAAPFAEGAEPAAAAPVSNPPAEEGTKEFAEGAERNVEEFKRERRKAPHRIDGRSRGAH